MTHTITNQDCTWIGPHTITGLYVIGGRLLFCYRRRKGTIRFRDCETGEVVEIFSTNQTTGHVVEVIHE